MSGHYDQRETLHAAQKDAASEARGARERAWAASSRRMTDAEWDALAGPLATRFPESPVTLALCEAMRARANEAELEAERDALKAEVGRLWDYACHKGDCEADDRNDEDCTCGLLKVKP